MNPDDDGGGDGDDGSDNGNRGSVTAATTLSILEQVKYVLCGRTKERGWNYSEKRRDAQAEGRPSKQARARG
eukprot:4697282-Pleurochrysis_carterae.AAC.1